MKAETGKGLLLALAAALISGFSVFINGVAVKLADPLVYTLLKNMGALAFLCALVLAFCGLKHFRNLSRRQWGLLILIGVVGGSVPFLMFFYGLKMGGAAVSSFIFRSLFVFAGVFGYLILKEKPEPRDVAAGFAILVGNALLVSGDMLFGPGQLLVLGATVLWALEYTISRKIISDVHPRAVMVSRMLFDSLILMAFLAGSGSIDALALVNAETLQWLALTSLLLSGFLLAWYTALRYLPVLKATVVLAFGGVITAALETLFIGKAVSLSEGLGLLLTLIGVLIAVSSAELLRSAARLNEPSPGLVE